MKRIAALLTVVVVGVTPALVASPASAHGPYCGVRWGSLPENKNAGSAGQLAGVRAGRHACFDRLVLDMAKGRSGYFVRYVNTVRADGSGTVVPVRGGAFLEIVTAPPTPTDAWFRADGRIIDTTGFRTFRDVVWAGSFEGLSTLGLGVRARLPFRVLLLDGPGDGARLVVDVAHRW